MEQEMKYRLTTSIVAVVAAMVLPAQAQQSQEARPDMPIVDSDACTQNWTTVDSDKNGAISRSEAKAVADSEFSRIDVDGNGTVSVTEWKDCGDPGSFPGNARDPRAADSPADADDTGNAEQADLDNTMQHNAIVGQGPDAVPPWNADDFSSFDTDRSGDLSADEAAEASRAGAGQAGEAVARWAGGMFARVDANADGKLSQEEWSNRNRQTFNDLFGRVDADGNGEITRSEWTNYREGGYSRASTSAQGGEPTIWQYYYFVVG